jgi:translation initiation factor 2 beta subunit (eIF-2beta)/eIF-5
MSSICLGEVYAPLKFCSEWNRNNSIYTIEFDTNRKRKGQLDGSDINFDRPSKVSLADKYTPRQVYDDIQYSDEDLETVLQNLRNIIYTSNINEYSDIDYVDRLMYSYDGKIKDKDKLIQRLQLKRNIIKDKLSKSHKVRDDYAYIVRTIKNGETVNYELHSTFERTLKIVELILDFL